MAFDANIPQPPDILSDSQDDLLNNFLELNTAWNINHVPFNILPNHGKHNQVTLPINAAPTATLANEANMFSQTSVFTGNTELAWQRATAGSIIEFTGLRAANSGWTRLPSGILIKWATAAVTGLNQHINFREAPTNPDTPAFANIFSVLLTTVVISGSRITSNIVNGSITTAGFNVDVINTNTGAGTTSQVQYLAIGI